VCEEFNMSRSSGIILVLAGVAIAAYGMPSIGETGLPELQDEAGASAADPVSLPAFRAAEASVSPPVVVTVVQRLDEGALSAQPRLAIPTNRDTLVRQLQKELRRVGCYDGDVNGAWTPTTRRAMKALVEHVNAVLPVDEPDPVHYAMAQSQPDQVCGRPCPTDQSRSEEGRCVPDAILARATKRSPAMATLPRKDQPPAEKAGGVVTGWKTTSTVAAAPLAPPPPRSAAAPFDGRMALAGPAAPEPTIGSPANDDGHARAPTKAAGPRAAAHKGKARAAPPASIAQAPRRGPLVKALFKFDWTL
jgi:peptidoglycan hydrolase-like protein with peptidoglycan-binding domain